jgi:hypothetical protein
MKLEPADNLSERDLASAGLLAGQPGQGEVTAWEEVSSGRYMPRRIKGSCKGRALG